MPVDYLRQRHLPAGNLVAVGYKARLTEQAKAI